MAAQSCICHTGTPPSRSLGCMLWGQETRLGLGGTLAPEVGFSAMEAVPSEVEAGPLPLTRDLVEQLVNSLLPLSLATEKGKGGL